MNQIKTVFLLTFLYSILVKAAYSVDWILDKEYSYPPIEKCYEVMKDGIVLDKYETTNSLSQALFYKDAHYSFLYNKNPSLLICTERKFKRK